MQYLIIKNKKSAFSCLLPAYPRTTSTLVTSDTFVFSSDEGLHRVTDRAAWVPKARHPPLEIPSLYPDVDDKLDFPLQRTLKKSLE